MKVTSSFLKPPSLPGSMPDSEKRITDQHLLKEFENSTKGRSAQRKLRVNIDQLKKFLCDKAPEADAAVRAFDMLNSRLSDGSEGWYGPMMGGFYKQGNDSLDALCVDVKNTDIPIEKRVSVVQNLAKGVEVCSEGVLSNLVMAAQELRLATVGMKGHAKQVWSEMLDEALIQYSTSKHGQRNNYEEYEIHYVNGYRNLLATQYGIDPKEDLLVPTEEVSCNVDDVTRYVQERVTAESLIRSLAERCLREVLEHFKDYAGRPLSHNEVWECYKKFKTIEAALETRYGPIDEHFLVSDSEGKGSEDCPFTIIADATLLMRAIARNLAKDKLITKAKFQVIGRKATTDTAEQSNVRIKRITDNTYYVKEMDRDGTKRYRTPQLSELMTLPSVPVNVLKTALLSNSNRASLRKLPAESVALMIRDDSSANWVENFCHPAVRRYRNASNRNNSDLESIIIEWILSYKATGQRESLKALMKSGEVDFANKVAELLGIENAASFCSPPVARKLVDQLTELHTAAENGDIRSTERLLRNGDIDINARRPFMGLTALMIAVDNEDVDMINLLARHSDLTVHDHRHSTALMRAVISDKTVGMAALLAAGADPDYVTPGREPRNAWVNHSQANSAMAVAAKYGKVESVAFLVEAGADVNKESFGESPLIFAIKAGQTEVVLKLLEHGASQEDPGGNCEKSPLVVALRHAPREIVNVLSDGASDASLRRAQDILWAGAPPDRQLINVLNDILDLRNLDNHEVAPGSPLDDLDNRNVGNRAAVAMTLRDADDQVRRQTQRARSVPDRTRHRFRWF
jgi:hypothetical protein